jgi:hypothetical protein
MKSSDFGGGGPSFLYLRELAGFMPKDFGP